MITFKQFLSEAKDLQKTKPRPTPRVRTKTIVMSFGRMNPVTSGHEKVVELTKKTAKRLGADHLVIASGSHGDPKNPLTPAQKEKHLKRAFPGTKIKIASKEHPTIMHHVKDASQKGYQHLVIIGGGDRVKEYHKLLKKYNGKEYNFRSIKVKNAGSRDGNAISATEMRNHVRNNNFYQFKKNSPSAIKNNDTLARELFNDVKKGLSKADEAATLKKQRKPAARKKK